MAGDKLISTGRGGAGNARSSTKIDKPDMSDTLPKLHGKRFTTGRGGAGNMMDNIDPDSTRAAQDEATAEFETDRVGLAPSTSRTVGRGGYGNNIRSMRSQQKYKQGGSDDKGAESKSFCEKISSVIG